MRQDIKIKRFGGAALYWKPFTSLLSYSILRRVTANKKYFHNEKDQSVYVLFTRVQTCRLDSDPSEFVFTLLSNFKVNISFLSEFLPTS